MTSASARLSIRLLGAPEIQVSGMSLALNHLKARALLFYLAASGQLHTREYLATLLWSESGSSEALHSLRSSLYRLRQALRPSRADSALVSDGENLGLQPASYQCDLIEFRRLLAQGGEGPLARAVALYRGPLLHGFSLADAPLFDDWVREEDTRLGQACFGALDQLATWAEARQAWATATGYLQQMTRIDPFAETPQQRLMQLYLRQGEVGLALRQYYQFENRLQQELNLAPSTETRALLYDALHRQRGPAVLTAAPSLPSAHPPHLLPFTGRDRLLQQLSAISQDVQSGAGMTVLLQGEGGIGKSRLLDELASRLISGSPPWILLQGACSPFDEPLSQGPFLEALQNGPQGDPASLLGELDASLPGARGRFSWGVLQIIRSLAHSVPLLLAIEDLQWANSSTLNLFGFLSMRIHHLPVLLVGTVQQAEAIPALQRLITLGRRRGELHVLLLTPLTQGNISALLQASGLDPASADALTGWLHARSTGNPFLLAEILAQIRAEGILHPVGNGWQLDAIRWLRWRTTFSLPETAHDLVAWRLANLSPEARQLLNVLAVAGQPLPAAILRQFPGFRGETLPVLVDDLANRGLIIEPPGAMLALPHHLLRETLLHHLSDLRRRSLHQQLAQALESHTSPGAGALPAVEALSRQIAMHAVAGEDVDRARRYGLRLLAGPPPETIGAEAVDFVHHLYDLLAPSASPGEMLQLTRALGRLHQTLGQLELAAHWHQENLAWAQEIGDPAAQAEAHFEKGELALMSNDYKLAAQAAQAGLSMLNAGGPAFQPSSYEFNALSGRAHRLLGAAFAMEGSDLPTAEKHLQQAVAAHRRTGNQGDLCAGLFELGNIAAQRGELGRALDFYAESAQTAEAGRIHYYLALARNNFAYHSLLLGQVGAAQQSVAQGLKVAEAYDLVAALLHLYSTQGEIHLYLAGWEQAEESFQRGLALAEDLGSLERQAGYRGGLALAARGRDDLASGIRLLEEGLALIAGQGYWHLYTRLQLWRAEMLFEQGRLNEAGQTLEAALAIASAQQRSLLLVQAERLRARLLAAGGDWTAANALFARTLESASGLGLPLEIARLQAAWGEAALQYSLAPQEGRALIAAARLTFLTHDARAALAALPVA